LDQGLVEFLIGAELAQTSLAQDLPSAFEEKRARIWEGEVAEGSSLLTIPANI